MGASWVGANAYAGMALDTYRNDYGVTVEPDVTIRMRRDRLSWAAQWRRLPGLWSQVEVLLKIFCNSTRWLAVKQSLITQPSF